MMLKKNEIEIKNMKIRLLNIDGYKIFKNEQFINFPVDLKPAIFVGVNGAGKTTIIEAIIGCLWEFYFKVQGKRLSKEEKLFSKININVYAEEFSKVKLEWEDNSVEKLKTGFELRKTIDPEYEFYGSEAISEYVESLKGDVGFFKNEANIPIVVYYPVERTVLEPSLKTRNVQKGNQFDSFDKAFEKSIDFNDFFEWFRSTEDLENEIRLNEDSSYTNKGLDAVRKAILVFLEDFTRIRVRRVTKTALVLEKNEQEFEVNQLSHGEKALIAMVGDLARRLVMANPGNPNPLNGRGIVLIDEVDLHLHPTWQRAILRKLISTFPKIQFICTTHSTLIINHLTKESIYLLEDGNCIALADKYTGFNTYGADVEDILKIVQGTEKLLPDEIRMKFEKLYEVIQKNDLEKAKNLIKELKYITDPNQPELKKAETQIKYKELTKG